jgi:predicted dehydrogenase
MSTRLGIISLDHLHAAHYLACLKDMRDVEIAAVAEPDPRRLAAHTELLQGIRQVSDYQELLASDDVDGVIVCAANSRHKPIVLDCARKGVPILCEKPIATRTEDAREMLAICDAHDAPLGICFPVRFSEPLRRANAVIREGRLGQVIAVKATNRGTMPGEWFVDPKLSGGGAVMDHTVHVVDALRWLFDAEFTRVFAHAATRLHNIPVEDVGLLTLEMSNEVFVSLDASWSRPNHSYPIWGDVNLEIVGTSGILELQLFPWTLSYYSEQTGKHWVEACDGDLNLRLLENFVMSIQGTTELSATGEDGLRALEVVEAAYKSIGTQRVVAL